MKLPGPPCCELVLSSRGRHPLLPGLGKLGLELLAQARADTGLMIITEAMDARGLELVAETAASSDRRRNMQTIRC